MRGCQPIDHRQYSIHIVVDAFLLVAEIAFRLSRCDTRRHMPSTFDPVFLRGQTISSTQLLSELQGASDSSSSSILLGQLP